MHPCLTQMKLRLITHEIPASKKEAGAVTLVCYRKTFEDPVSDATRETQRGPAPLLDTSP